MSTKLDHSKRSNPTNLVKVWGIDGFDRALASPLYSETQLLELLRSAFRHLDAEVDRGRIGGYMWSSNALSLPTTAANVGWDLEKVIAQVQRPDNFVAVEYPFNIFEKDVARAPHPTSSSARRHDLCQFLNRPLNAIGGGSVRTLSDGAEEVDIWIEGWSTEEVEDAGILSRQLSELFERGIVLEEEFRHFVEDAENPPPTSFPSFAWSQALLDHAPRLAPNLLATRHFLTATLTPQVRTDLEDAAALAEEWGGEEGKRALEWIEKYHKFVLVDIPPLLTALSKSLTISANRELDSLIRPLLPPAKRPAMPGLASTALKLVGSVDPGDPALWESQGLQDNDIEFESGVVPPVEESVPPLGYELPYQQERAKLPFGFEALLSAERRTAAEIAASNTRIESFSSEDRAAAEAWIVNKSGTKTAPFTKSRAIKTALDASEMSNVPLAVRSFEDFVTRFGHYGGWSEQDHRLFVRLREKFGSRNPRFLNSCIEALPSCAPDDISRHEEWYAEYSFLMFEKKRALVEWKSKRDHKNSIKEDPTTQADTKSDVDAKNDEHIKRTDQADEKRKRIEEWRQCREKQKQEEEAKKLEESEKRAATEERKRAEQQAHLRAKAEEFRHRKAEEAVAKEEEECIQKEQERKRAAMTKELIERLQEKDSLFIQRREELIVAKRKEEMERELRVAKLQKAAEFIPTRDPSRVLRPTTASELRSKVTDPERDGEKVRADFAANKIPRKQIPSWRTGL
ncbi:hypothetical protein HDU93_003310 [Gonapodya sp. JEL0774]|nr:hypothetical protein HDU93_003310 [Gonapodya sp. JEL0774]